MPRDLDSILRRPFLTLGCLAMVACGQVEGAAIPAEVAEHRPADEVVVLQAGSAAPEGTDAPPLVVLARRAQDGTTTPLPGKYVSAIEFRDGRAAVTRDRELHLVSADGSTSVLAQQVDGLPSQASDGALVYAARFGASVEIYWLSTNGNNRRLASFAGSATRLSPRADTAVVFVGAKSGGVSGIWIANAKGARCLTNCKLGAGRPWTDGYRPPPGDTGTVRIFADRVEWQDAEGRAQVAPLGEKP